jgi:hypothetical protein
LSLAINRVIVTLDRSPVPSLFLRCAASGFGSINKYLFGNIGMRLKLVPGDSAGTVIAYYVAALTLPSYSCRSGQML